MQYGHTAGEVSRNRFHQLRIDSGHLIYYDVGALSHLELRARGRVYAE